MEGGGAPSESLPAEHMHWKLQLGKLPKTGHLVPRLMTSRKDSTTKLLFASNILKSINKADVAKQSSGSYILVKMYESVKFRDKYNDLT